MYNSKIDWTDHTFNPRWGCLHASLAGEHCYAERFAGRKTRTQKVSGLTAVRDNDILSVSLEESTITDYAARNIDLRTRARATNCRLR
jgi:protein gp37